MSPDAYCAERGPRPGSSSYYAIKFAADQGRAGALYALLRDLHAIVATVSDANVAAAKLAWWQVELAALGNGAMTHPITLALAEHGFGDPNAKAALLRATQAVSTDLTQTRFLDDTQLESYCRTAGGAPLSAYALASGIKLPEALGAIDDLGAAIARGRLLLRVGHDGRQGRIYLPHEELRRFEVPAAEVLGGTQTPRLMALVREQAHRASQRMKTALAALRPYRRAVKSTVILGQLNLALLNALEEDGFQVALHRVSLTPLRKFLIAWRFARLSW